ncbi:DUF2922 domain-containing protein [Macrococcoides canis]|uniref:DUF2922 domain-containing protein n=1 Tax=Macrococcoides canis TaxID=1855823 RepID=UPI0020B85500|nr:DUF2922 domain-containing protein [Macrococcus canis]UTH03500.1 DUF2922 domain-containing protein [Macrococcus canis]
MKSLQLNFITEIGKNYTMTIVSPKEGVTTEEVLQVMESLISQNYITTTSGALKSIKSAKLIDRTEQILFENK